ncbi:MAG: UDP-N-acetylglucosamine 2-epimerase [Thermodesulfobacteriota bacterium]
MKPRTISIITGSRADYGYLATLMRLVQADPGCLLQTVVTGMHLWPAFGETWRTIEADGFPISARVEAPLHGTSPVDVARTTGRLTEQFAVTLSHLAPDFAVVLGDRYEIFAAAQACLFLRIPLAHLAGGDITEGAYDDAMRHAITKMASLHFVTNEQAARRVVQLGEEPQRVFCVGATNLDLISALPLLSRKEMETQLGFTFRSRNLLVTFHPVTLSRIPSKDQVAELLAALDELAADGKTGILFTAPNADTEGLDLLAILEEYTATRPHVRLCPSLGQQRYYSAVAACDVVVGNSSSGLYEVPSLKRPSVDIGDRQKGRIRAESVLHCEPERDAIRAAIEQAYTLDCAAVVNPYGRGDASATILNELKAVPDPKALTMKKFRDLP